MAKRFGRLKYALETLRTPNSTAAVPDAPTGTIARKFQDYKAGKVKLKYPRDAESKQKSILKISVMPFYRGGAAGSEIIVPMSQRASDDSDTSAIQTQCNQVDANFETHSAAGKFKPAKITVYNYGTTTSSETSDITGISYKAKVGKSVTLPYGASTAEKTEGEVRKGLLTAVKALGTASASFQPEKH